MNGPKATDFLALIHHLPIFSRSVNPVSAYTLLLASPTFSLWNCTGRYKCDINKSLNPFSKYKLTSFSPHLVLKPDVANFLLPVLLLRKKNPLNCKSSNIAWASFFIKLKLPHPWPEVILGWKFFPIRGQWIFSTITIFKSVASTDLNV